MNTQKKNYALPIAIMFLLFFIIAFVTGLQNPFAVIVKSQFGASNFLSQLGTFANFIAYAFMGIPAGLMLKKYGYKMTALAAVTVGFLGVGITWISGQAGSYGVYLIGAFISGFSMCMLNTVVNPMLTSLGSTPNKGNQLIQFGGACNSVGATLAPILVGYLMGADESLRTIAKANPALYIAMGIFLLAFIVLYFTKLPEPHIEKVKSKVKDKYSAMSFRHFVLGIIAIFIYVGVEVCIPNITNLYLTSPVNPADGAIAGLGLDTAVAGTIVGTYWLLMLVGRLVGGAVGAKVSPKAMLTGVSCLGLLFILIAIFTFGSQTMVSLPVFTSSATFGLEAVPLSFLFLILCGLATSVMWGAIFSLATNGLGKYIAAASGIFMVMVCGGGVLPALQGWIADMAGYTASYWVIIVGLVYLLFYALWGSRNVNKNIPVE